MEASHKFFKCDLCGNFTGLIHSSGVPLMCCGQEMTEQVPNTVEASVEKHLPEVTTTANGIGVQVGSVSHPMTEEHHITFVYVGTENGGQRKCFKVGAEPKCEFNFVDDKPLKVLAYCNLHGLWESEV